ncbi:MAG: HAMP domain-containing sensor histidine kinase [Clostridia bacterium]
MKKLSIKLKVTLWYTGLIVLLMLAVFSFIFVSAEQTVTTRAKTNLEDVTNDIAGEIEYDDGKLSSDKEVSLYDKGIYIVIYQGNNPVLGKNPVGFPTYDAMSFPKTSTVAAKSENWLVYDLISEGDLSVRGIYSLNTVEDSISQIMLFALISFPFIAIIAAIGGYFITKKAFSPIKKMYKTAASISSGDDLSERINLQNTGDEVSKLAETFDQMFDRLEKAFESERQFTSDVSHELRTPIAVLASQCEYALTQEQNPEETTKALQIILSQTNKMSILVAQLLELARAQHQTQVLQMEKVDISELLEVVVEELMGTASEKSISLTTDINKNIIVSCDQTLIMRLFINLINNAVKYTNENGKIEVAIEQKNNAAIISITDTGVGIEKEHLDKLFNRFYQVDDARTGGDNISFGLGLALCKWIVNAHNGKIEVASQIGIGSRFTVKLPLSG